MFASSNNGLISVKGALFICTHGNPRKSHAKLNWSFFFSCLIYMQLTKLSLIDISLREGRLFGRQICRENHTFESGIFSCVNTLNQDILTGKVSQGTLVNIDNFLFLIFSHITNAPLNKKFVSAKPENSCHLFKRCNALFYGRIHFTGDMCSLDHCLNF